MISGRSSLVVHSFAPINARSGKSVAPPHDELISKGRDTVSALETRDGWRTVSPPSDLSMGLGRTLVFKKSPPSPSSFSRDVGKKPSIDRVKEWVDTSGARAVLDISKLKEFEGSDFSYLLERKRPSRNLPVHNSKDEKLTLKEKKRTREATTESDNDEGQRPKKRRPIGNSTMSLYDLIPQPHHHPYSPIAVNQRPDLDITKRFPPFSKAPFHPIASFSPSKAEIYLKDPYARSAWVIPVEGNLPWKEASPARIDADSTISTSQSARVPTMSFAITWTPLVINKFWVDLLEIRKQGVLGAVSLSFHMASAEKTQLKAPKTMSIRQTRSKKATNLPSLPDNLNSCTYVKVYHDVRYAMFVRSVLDAWRTEVEVPGPNVAPSSSTVLRKSRSRSAAMPAPKKVKVRPLQGAKFVLLSEDGQGVGLC